MNKEIVIKILETNSITQEELYNFITDYVMAKKNRLISGQELSALATMLQQGFLNLRSAALQAAEDLGLTVLCLLDNASNPKKTWVY
jgi:hypothetical protein